MIFIGNYEFDMEKERYQKEFSNFISIMGEALKKNDFTVYEAARDMLDESVDTFKKEESLESELKTTNFGRLNHIFEEALPDLLRTNRKAVRNVIRTIKEDKNLLGEFNFYHLIRNYDSKVDETTTPDEMLSRIEEITSRSIDRKTLAESNRKLMKTMMDSGVLPLSHIDEKSSRLYESGSVILSEEPRMTNLYRLQESRGVLREYMEENRNKPVRESLDVDKLFSDFENKMKKNLTESEISFVKQITDFKSPIAEKRKASLFNKLREDCLTAIEGMLKEDSENEELKNLRTQLSEMKFSNDTIVTDVAKLLEVRDILLDK
jgi:hypothetical protein